MSASTKLTLWTQKKVPGGRVLRLVHEQMAGMSPTTVASWPREEVDQMRDEEQSIGAAIIDAARDHADSLGESCRFQLQWIDDRDVVLRAIHHREMPTEMPDNEGAIAAGFVSGNQLIGEMMSHIRQQQKVVNGGFQIALAAHERALAMQAKMLEQQNNMLQALVRERNETLAKGDSVGPLVEAKVNALTKLAEVAPDVLQLIIAKVADHYSAGAPKAKLTNGAGAAAA
jgi:hypothetical protein